LGSSLPPTQLFSCFVDGAPKISMKSPDALLFSSRLFSPVERFHGEICRVLFPHFPLLFTGRIRILAGVTQPPTSPHKTRAQRTFSLFFFPPSLGRCLRELPVTCSPGNSCKTSNRRSSPFFFFPPWACEKADTHEVIFVLNSSESLASPVLRAGRHQILPFVQPVYSFFLFPRTCISNSY